MPPPRASASIPNSTTGPVARLALAPAERPVGVVRAMLGGPFFIWLRRPRRRSLWR